MILCTLIASSLLSVQEASVADTDMPESIRSITPAR